MVVKKEMKPDEGDIMLLTKDNNRNIPDWKVIGIIHKNADKNKKKQFYGQYKSFARTENLDAVLAEVKKSGY